MDEKKNRKKPLLKENGKSFLRFFVDTFQSIFKNFKNNWPWKLTAVLLALVLWGGVISQDKTVTRIKIFENVPISNLNTFQSNDTLNKRNGLVVTTDFSENQPTVTVSAEVPVSEYSNLTIDNIDLRILSTTVAAITAPGTQSIKITPSTTMPSAKITQINPSTIDINVERYQQRSFQITLTKKGSLKSDEFIQSNLEGDPKSVVISGPDEIIKQIRKVNAEIDLSNVPLRYGEFGDNVPLTMEIKDEEGRYVSMPAEMARLVEITSDDTKINAIYVKMMLNAQKLIEVDPNLQVITGAPEEGYEVADVIINPETIRIYGTEAAVEQFDEVFLDSETLIDVTGMVSESLSPNQNAKAAKVKILNNSQSDLKLVPDELTVSYKIVPAMKSRTIEERKILVEGLGEGLVATITRNIEASYVNINAAGLWLDMVKDSEVELFVDVTGLGIGSHERVPVQVRVAEKDGRETATQVDAVCTPGIDTVHIVINTK